MIENYEAARAAVDAAKRPLWDGAGTFYVDTTGFENDRHYLVPWGAREWLVDGDEAHLLINGVWTLVNKITEEVVDVLAIESMALVDSMRPVDE